MEIQVNSMFILKTGVGIKVCSLLINAIWSTSGRSSAISNPRAGSTLARFAGGIQGKDLGFYDPALLPPVLLPVAGP